MLRRTCQFQNDSTSFFAMESLVSVFMHTTSARHTKMPGNSKVQFRAWKEPANHDNDANVGFTFRVPVT